MLVLVATSAAFALAMQGSVALRTAMAEALAMRHRTELRRDASSAATIALAALTAGPPRQTDTVGAQSAPGASTSTAPPDTTDLPEMPPEMKDLLLGVLSKNKGPGVNPSSLRSGTAGLALSHRGGPFAALRKRGLPTTPLTVTVNDRKLAVTITDAAGVLNINTASADQLRRYFRALGLVDNKAVALADEIVDWRDEDNLPRSHGAERADYLRRNITIRNAPFQTIDELLYLPDMTRPLLDSIRPDLTLLGDGKIDAQSASLAVLKSAPDMTDQAAARIISLRKARRLDRDSLTEALGVIASDAAMSLRLTPTSFVHLRIEPIAGGPVYLADAVIDDERGVQLTTLHLMEN